jgi:hypothetical protein
MSIGFIAKYGGKGFDTGLIAYANLLNPSFYAKLLLNLITDKPGGGAMTFARTTTASVVDFEGVVRTARIGEARFSGMRRVENLLTYSEAFDNAAWGKIVYTVTANSVAAPNGTTTADKLDEATTSSVDRYAVSSLTAIISGANCTASIYVKDAGRGFVQLRLSNNNGTFSICYLTINLNTLAIVNSGTSGGTFIGTSITSVGGGWYRLSVAGSLAADVTQAALVVYGHNGSTTTYAGVPGTGVYLWGAQLENVTGQSIQTPGEYQSTNVLSSPYQGAGVDGVQYYPYKLDGTSISSSIALGYLNEPARTNLLTYSEQFDNVVWVNYGTVTRTANTFASPSGSLSADTLVIAASSGIYQQIAVAINTQYTASIYIRGSTAQNVDFIINGTSSGITGKTVAVTTSWQRVSVTKTTNALDVSVSVQLYNSSTNAAFEVWGAQLEAASSASTYIPTTSTAVTRASDVLSSSVTASATQGTFVVALRPAEVPSTTGTYPAVALIGSSLAEAIAIDQDSTGASLFVVIRSGGVQKLASIIATTSANTLYKVAVSWIGTAIKVSVNGGAVQSFTATGMPASLLTLQTSFDTPWNGNVTLPQVYLTALPNATLQSLTS